MLDRSDSNASRMDRIGQVCLGLLLLSPLVFKVRLVGDAVVHPLAPLLFVVWCWTIWAVVDAIRRHDAPLPVEWSIVTPPVLLMGCVILGFGCSLAINALQSGSWQSGGWLLLLKAFLYLAPLAFTALLVIRSGLQVVRLLNGVIPPVAFLTLVYSFYRLWGGQTVAYVNSGSEFEPRYFVMGTFGEILTNDGLVLRTDTVAQGAYGMYLVLVVVFSLALALLSGMDAGLPRWYVRGQAFLVCPAAVIGILNTGSRTSLILLSGVLLLFPLVLLWHGAGALTRTDAERFLLLLIVVSAGAWSAHRYLPVSFPTLHRFEETLKGEFELQRSALGTFFPLTNEPRKAVVRNVESRLWLWGKTVRYLADHPTVLITGIGNDRKRFAKEVTGLSYEGDQVHFHTAHNLYLDVLVKGGVLTLASLVMACLWFFRLAVRAVKTGAFKGPLASLAGIGMVLLAFWPPFVFVNLLGEEMFTDNLQLHWTILFGVVIGLLSRASFAEKSTMPGSFPVHEGEREK
jgi:O-antigen ligase